MNERLKVTILAIVVCFGLVACTSSRYWGEGYRVWEIRLHKDEKLRELKAEQVEPLKQKQNVSLKEGDKIITTYPPQVEKKSNYKKLKEQYKEEWLNLPNPLPKDHQEQIKNQ